MLELIERPDKAEWDRFVAAHPRSTVFHRSAWLSLVSRVAGAELHPFAVCRGGEQIGVFPIFVLRRGPFRIAASPPPQAAAPYLGPIVDDGACEEALQAGAEAARRLGAAYFECRMDHHLSPPGLERLGFACEPRATLLLDLTPGPDELWKSWLDSGCRRAVRKAQKSGVTIEEERLDRIADRYAAMAASVFAKHNRRPPLSRDDYLAVAEAIEQGASAKVLVARLHGEIVAAGIFPFANGTVYYLDGVSDPAGQQARPNNLLHWEVIRWACAGGVRRYDMVGAGIAGVARFKLGFGPVEMPYTYAFRSIGRLAGMARAAYALAAPAARAVQYAWTRAWPRDRAESSSEG